MSRRALLIGLLLWTSVAAVEPAPGLPDQGELAEREASSPQLEPLPEALLDAYFAGRPAKFLCDPQRLLPPVVARDRAAFLEYHADDSRIDFHLMMIGGHQQVEESRMADFMERFFTTGKPAVVVVYPLGAAERTTLWLSRHLRESLPDAERRRALETSVLQAMEKSGPMEQLEAFLVQLSIRVYWMERALGFAGREEDPVRLDAPAAVPAVVTEAGVLDRLTPIMASAGKWAEEAVLGCGAMLMAAGIAWWRRATARYRFPDFGVEPRLGGQHGAGVGAVISFASAAVSPAAQRGDSDDCLGKL